MYSALSPTDTSVGISVLNDIIEDGSILPARKAYETILSLEWSRLGLNNGPHYGMNNQTNI